MEDCIVENGVGEGDLLVADAWQAASEIEGLIPDLDEPPLLEGDPCEAKRWLNGPERCLLKKWADVRLLEKTAESVREKYKVVLGKVLDRVREEHEELDRLEVHANDDATTRVRVGAARRP